MASPAHPLAVCSRALLLLTALLLSGCAGTRGHHAVTHPSRRYTGHVTEGVAFLRFTPLHSLESREVTGVPTPLARYLEHSPLTPDARSRTGYSHSAYVDLTGTEIETGSRRVFRIDKVREAGAPRPEYLRALARREVR